MQCSCMFEVWYFSIHIAINLLLSLLVKKMLKSINIWQGSCKKVDCLTGVVCLVTSC